MVGSKKLQCEGGMVVVSCLELGEKHLPQGYCCFREIYGPGW